MFSFKGRARRSEFWYIVLFCFIFAIVIEFYGILIGLLIEITVLSKICILFVLIPGIATGVRRMHDVGKSGWFLLIPIYNLILACTDGENGGNEYGNDPKVCM